LEKEVDFDALVKIFKKNMEVCSKAEFFESMDPVTELMENS
jgi:hypothetical protein